MAVEIESFNYGFCCVHIRFVIFSRSKIEKKKNCYGQLNGRSRNCRLCLLAYYSCSLTWRSIRRFDLPFPVLRINTCCCHIIAQRQGAVCLHCYYTTLYTQYRFENTARADNVYNDWHCFRFELSISNHI